MPIAPFYPILDIATLAARGCSATDAACAILHAGAAMLQYRDKAALTRRAWEQIEQISRMCRDSNALFVINDRVDLALLASGAVHLGQDDLPPAEARRLGESLYIGLSTHNEAQLRSADQEPVDYLALGPIFGTVSKANPDPAVGIEELRRLRPLTKKPLVAIGGITRDTAPRVLEAGANSLAIISDLYPDPCTPAGIGARAAEWIRLLR